MVMFGSMSAFSVVLLGFAITHPHWLTIGFFSLALLVAAFGAYRSFCFSDDWYRVRADRHRLWIEAHPRLWAGLFYLAILAFIAKLIFELARSFG